MVFDTAKRCIDEIFQKDAADADRIEVNFIGGEPLLEYDLLKKLFEYTKVTYNKPFYLKVHQFYMRILHHHFR